MPPLLPPLLLAPPPPLHCCRCCVPPPLLLMMMMIQLLLLVLRAERPSLLLQRLQVLLLLLLMLFLPLLFLLLLLHLRGASSSSCPHHLAASRGRLAIQDCHRRCQLNGDAPQKRKVLLKARIRTALRILSMAGKSDPLAASGRTAHIPVREGRPQALHPHNPPHTTATWTALRPPP